MLSWKKITPLLVLLLGSAIAINSLHAQTKSAEPATLIDQRMSQLQQRLDLTADQQKKVREIQTSHMERMKALVAQMQEQGSRMERVGVIRQIQALRQDTGKRMASVLNPQQAAAYEQFTAEQESRMRERMQERQKASR